jgi:hypothetical protein
VLTCMWTTPSGDSLLNNHPLAHSMPGAGVVHHIIRVVLTLGRTLPDYPGKQTFLVAISMSQRCQQRTKVRPRSYFGLRGNGMNPSRFGILTLGSECASITSFGPMIPLRLRI